VQNDIDWKNCGKLIIHLASKHSSSIVSAVISVALIFGDMECFAFLILTVIAGMVGCCFGTANHQRD
jgi:hypothetical protein